MKKTHFQKLLIARGIKQSELARRLGVNKSTIALWSLRRVPAERVLEVEKITGVARHDLRPDIYPPQPQNQPEVEAAE